MLDECFIWLNLTHHSCLHKLTDEPFYARYEDNIRLQQCMVLYYFKPNQVDYLQSRMTSTHYNRTATTTQRYISYMHNMQRFAQGLVNHTLVLVTTHMSMYFIFKDSLTTSHKEKILGGFGQLHCRKTL